MQLIIITPKLLELNALIRRAAIKASLTSFKTFYNVTDNLHNSTLELEYKTIIITKMVLHYSKLYSFLNELYAIQYEIYLS